jgi:ribosomal protein S12 methylthiotransferase accessory factor
MESILTIAFEGGRRFTSEFTDDSFRIPSDQSPANGGQGRAPEPFQLFLAGLASCAAVYIQGYAEKKGVDWKKLTLRLHGTWNDNARAYEKLDFCIESSEALSEKTRQLLETAVMRSAVTRHLQTPPQIEVKII